MQLELSGRIAYVAQTAWIQTGSVRDNILFGLPYDEVKYKKAIKACALEQDIKNFSHGDLTEIGERGINMSGGQKQRIQLARAVYNDADLYLLDDPFSAVDAQTAATLFEVRKLLEIHIETDHSWLEESIRVLCDNSTKQGSILILQIKQARL